MTKAILSLNKYFIKIYDRICYHFISIHNLDTQMIYHSQTLQLYSFLKIFFLKLNMR